MSSPQTPLPRFWFGPPPEFEAGEEWVAHYAANRTQRKRAVGGGLHITNQRVLFCPNVVDRSLGGQPWECAVAEVSSVSAEPGRFSLAELFSGGLRTRLRVDLRDGATQFFVVARVAEAQEKLSAMLATADG
ncbi:MAG: hypothetical protein JRH11_18445 [Deltaproteobacteria bacterium]|nr:hypothetical protein [Deltaproteobacteria bacterium]